MRRFLAVALSAIVCILLGSAAQAQRLDGTLRVTVIDKSQASIEDAKVTATNLDTGVAVTTTASSSGTYVFPNLLVGAYSVSVEKDGFKKAVQKGIAVSSNQVSEARVELELGSVSAVVEVEAGADLVKTETSTLENTFSGKAVQEIPINTAGGDVKEFAVYAPGTTTQQGGVLGSGGSIGGTRPRFNGFSIDGVDDNKLDTNGPTQPVIQESVAEFTLLTNQFGAENGHSAGGQFNIVTKSGTNNWHGSGWGYDRNRNYDAFDNLQKQRGLKDRFDYNRAGASAGGPIRKNKLFVYGAYEFQNNGLASSSPSFSSPTAAGLTTLMSLSHDSAVTDILNQFPVAPTADGTVVVNGQDIPIGTIQSVAPNYANQHDFIVNVDASLGKHQLRGRFLYDRFRAPDFNPSQPQAQFLGSNSSDARKVIFTDAWSVTNSVINDFRASYSRLNGPNLVVPGGFQNFPNVEVDELGSNLGPDGLAPQGYAQNVYQWVDNISVIRGKHTFKFGAEVRKYISPTNTLPRARGEWDYASLETLINDLVPDGANGALRGAGSGAVADNYNAFYGFFQDDWKITPRLTLNLGVRYEYSGVPRDENLQAINAVSDDPSIGLVFRAPKPDTNNFAPRVGFAWDPRGNGKWAVRGGAGLAYDVVPNNFAVNSLPPQLQTEQNPVITCALAGAPQWCTAPNQQGFLQFGGLLQVNVPPVTQADARAATQSLIPDHISPKVITWTLGVQHELFKNSSIEVRYVGTRSLELPVQRRLNSASAFDSNALGGPIAPLPTYINASDVPANVVAPASTLQSFDNYNPQPLSAEGFFGNLTTFPPIGSGIYHAASVDFIHRFARGIYLRANYTYSKNIDNATNELFSSRVNPRRAQDGFDFPGERGLSALNIPHKLAISFLYEIPNVPTENRFVKTLAHGWEWGGTYLAESGQPVTPLSGVDSNANGDSAGDRTIINPNGHGLTGSTVTSVCNFGPGGSTSFGDCDPNHLDDPTATCNPAIDPNHCVDPTPADAFTVGYLADNPTAKFIQAGVGAKANAGRNTVTTPGLNVWNMSLIKNTRLTERFSLEFRAETYNTFNHRNFSLGLPTNNGTIDQVTNPNPLSAGYIFVTSGNLFLNNRQFNGGSRTMQLGLRLQW